MPPTFFLLLEGSSRVDFFFNILRSASFKTSTKAHLLTTRWTLALILVPIFDVCGELQNTEKKENCNDLASIWVPLNNFLLFMGSLRTYKWETCALNPLPWAGHSRRTRGWVEHRWSRPFTQHYWGHVVLFTAVSWNARCHSTVL